MSTKIEGNFNSITIDVVCEIEKELLDSPYDMTSLVFLLYDIPDTALQRLLVYQRISKDKYSTNLNLLHEWTQVAKLKPTWKYEFLEALLICQLYGIVKKLGFNVQSMKKQYQPDDIYHNIYVNATKKALYKLCENMNANNLSTLKKTLKEFNIDTSEYESCELVFLKLMSEKVITITESQCDKKFNFDKLVKLIQKLPGLETFARELSMMQEKGGKSIEPIGQPVATSSPSADPSSDVSITQPRHTHSNEDFTAIYDMLRELDETDLDENHIKSDSNKLAKNMYPIKDPNKIGVCLIINQEDFHLCDQSIEDINLKTSLTMRKGSTYDKIQLEKTMSSMNFEVVTRDNLNHIEMIDCIKRCIRENVIDTTSVFMLCIMSHGVRGHIFAADSVKVKVEDIQNLLDSDDAQKLQGIPKVLVLQACQVDEVPVTRLIADSPNPNTFKLRKLDFLIYWATSPEYEAFRVEEAGSIFIQLLCLTIQKKGKQEHLNDIFTRVNNYVIKCCTKFRCFQVPLFKNTLRKNLYLHIPG